MKFRFSKSGLTCVALEAALGLSPGAIKRLTVYPDGTMDVEADSLTLAQKDKIAALVGAVKVTENPPEVPA